MIWMLLWLVVFLVGIYSVGIYYSRKIETEDSYLIADHKLGFFPICGSIIATALGAAAVVGAAGKGFTMGIAWKLVTSPFAICSIFLAIFLGGIIRRMKLLTIPQLFERRYGRGTGILPSFVISILYMTPTFAMQLVAMAAIFTSIFQIPFIYAIFLSFTICTGFTLLGGLPSVAWTDAVQSVLMLVGLILLSFLSLIKIGGLGTLYTTHPEAFDVTTPGLKGYLNWMLIFGPFYFVWQTTWQRFSAAKSEKIAVRAVVWGYIITFAVGFTSTFVGICAKMLLPVDTKPDMVFTEMLNIVAHPALAGLFMVSLFAALLTGATSFLLSGATNIAQDMLKTHIKPHATEKELLKYSRCSVAFMAILGLVIAIGVKDIITIYSYALSLSAVTLFIPAAMAMFWERATKKGIIICMFGSLIFTLAWRFLERPFELHEVIPGLVVSFLLMYFGSLLTEHNEDEEVKAYYFAYKNDKK